MSRTVFLGTSEFAASVLGRLSDSPHRPSLVVAPPTRPRGRGRRPAASPVALAAGEQGIELLEAGDVNEPGVVEAILAAEPEVGSVCAFGQLIGAPLLSRLEMLNVHPSLLPRWRGAAPIERAIMAGDAETGVCIIAVAEGLDSGPVAVREATRIGPEENFGSLAARLEEVGARLLVRALDLREAGKLEFEDQGADGVTYAEKITVADRRLDPSRDAPSQARTVRALTPHVGAFVATEGGGRLGVRAARAEPGLLGAGEIRPEGDALLLGCGEGILRIERLQPPGSRPMEAADYLRGHDPPSRAEIP